MKEEIEGEFCVYWKEKNKGDAFTVVNFPSEAHVSIDYLNIHPLASPLRFSNRIIQQTLIDLVI